MQKSSWIGFAVLVGIAGFVFFPVFERAYSQSKQQSEQGMRLLTRNVTGVRPLGRGAVLSLTPRVKRGFRVYGPGNDKAKPEDTIDVQTPLSLSIQQDSTFQFSFRHSGYSFRVQNISQQGVRVQILNSAPWFSPDATVLLPWSAQPNTP